MHVSTTNMNVFNSIGVESSNSVRRPKSKDTKSNNRVLKNTNAKSSSTHVWKVSSSVRIDSNKRKIMNSTICQSNTSVLNTKTTNAVNDGSNIVCVSCGKDVFMLSHEKCVARYALSVDSKVKRALYTTPIAVKYKNLRATSVLLKSRLSGTKTPTATNKVIQLILWIIDSGCSKHMTSNRQLLRNFIEKFMGIVRFGNDHFIAITGYGDYVQGNLMICHVYYVEGLGHNLFSVRQFCDGDLEVAFCSNTCYVRNLKGDDLLTATSTKLWLWHRRISHLNFGNINHLTSKDLVDGLLKFKYNKTPYELIQGRNPNVQYFHVFGSLCYSRNDRDDLGKMKPKTNIGIFIGYSESSRGFCIYNRRTKQIIETIHVKFDELTVMALECNNSGPSFSCSNFQDSSEVSQSVPSKIDLDNLFSPLYEEYYAMSTTEVLDNSTSNTLDNEDTPSSASIIIEEDEALEIVSSSEELVDTKPNTSVANENADELVQEDVTKPDKNVLHNLLHTLVFEEAESSSTYQDPSNMHEFYQICCSTDNSKPVMTRHRLYTDAKIYDLNQFKRLDVWELVERPAGRNIIAIKWL
ncbi:retrovirus-related pol polyprotein from transposon TNT 1-94 [Tanacetum coccineum]